MNEWGMNEQLVIKKLNDIIVKQQLKVNMFEDWGKVQQNAEKWQNSATEHCKP